MFNRCGPASQRLATSNLFSHPNLHHTMLHFSGAEKAKFSMSRSCCYGIRKRTSGIPPSVAAAHRLEQQDALMEIQSGKRKKKKKHRAPNAKANIEEASERFVEIQEVYPYLVEEIR